VPELTDIQVIAKLRSPAKSLLSRPVLTTVDLALSDQDELLESVEKTADYGSVASLDGNGLEDRAYMPFDFVEDSFLHPESMPDYSSQSHALVVGMPLDDPFGADDALPTLHPQPNYNDFHFFHMDDLTSDRPQINGIQEQSMQALQQYSATLHAVMDMRPAAEGITDYAARPLEGGHRASNVTPLKNVTAADISYLMLTDEINHFGGLGTYTGGGSIEQSPLSHVGLAYTTTINMHPMSPIRASTEIQGRRVFTLHDDDENIEF
jgi:hypothetical protein